MSDLSRTRILEMLEDGIITAEQAIRLLDGAVDDREAASPQPEPVLPVIAAAPAADATPPAATGNLAPAGTPAEDLPPVAAEVTPDPFRDRTQVWRRWWWIPFWVGVGITLLGALLMFLAWNTSGFGFWFACTWFPFFFGVLVMALAWASRTARWLHVRIHNTSGDGPRNIAISLPLPLRLAAWFARTFHIQIPHMNYASLDELIQALERTTPDAPFHVEVNDDDGEHVEVYIG